MFKKRASIGMESDGSLLDGASLANEWSLPVLPEGVEYTTTAVSVAIHTHIMCSKLSYLLVQLFLTLLLLCDMCLICMLVCAYSLYVYMEETND